MSNYCRILEIDFHFLRGLGVFKFIFNDYVYLSSIVVRRFFTLNYYRPPTKLREGNIFTSICLFTGGGMRWVSLIIHVPSGMVGTWGWVLREWVPGVSTQGWVPRGVSTETVSTQWRVLTPHTWDWPGSEYLGVETHPLDMGPTGGWVSYMPPLLARSGDHQNMFG